MGDSNSATAKRVIGRGGATAATVKAAYTAKGTVKAGASRATVERAKKALSTARKRTINGRRTRRTNTAVRAATAANAAFRAGSGVQSPRAALNRLRGD